MINRLEARYSQDLTELFKIYTIEVAQQIVSDTLAPIGFFLLRRQVVVMGSVFIAGAHIQFVRPALHSELPLRPVGASFLSDYQRLRC